MISVPAVIKSLVGAPLHLLTKTAFCTLMWFTNKCTYLKPNALPWLACGCFETASERRSYQDEVTDQSI